jgi:hypothetical protein
MVFDGKDGRRKGRLVAGRSHTVIASEQVLSGVVDIETVRTILALSELEAHLLVLAAWGGTQIARDG